MVALPAALDNPREVIGGNNPPPNNAIENARGCFTELSKFLTENPVIQDETQAREAAQFVSRAKSCIAGIEKERKAQVEPLNAQVNAINAQYKKPRETVQKLTDEVSGRLTAYAREEERKRIERAEAARREAEEKERLAREAEAREREAKENAEVGEIVNVSAAIVEADQKFDEFSKASREAARAEREIPVRLGDGLGRVVSMRTKETLLVDDWQKAITALGLTDSIRDAILTSARAYRKLNGELPAGVTSQTERSI